LVEHARTINEGLGFLRDGQVDRQAVALLRGDEPYVGGTGVKHLSPTLFTAFISLLCRFAPRVESSEDNSADDRKRPRRMDIANGWDLLRPGSLVQNSLVHAFNIVLKSKSKSRPAWYALFHALARRGVIIDRTLVGEPENDILAWQTVERAFTEFLSLGLELDPLGFQYICNCLEKGILASLEASKEVTDPLLSGAVLLKKELLKMLEITTESYGLTRLLHSIRGNHLHAYVRVMGLLNDHDELLHILRWMVERHEDLGAIADQARNGHTLLRRTLVAIRIFCHDSEYGAEAERLVESVESWDGWPTETEANAYLAAHAQLETNKNVMEAAWVSKDHGGRQ